MSKATDGRSTAEQLQSIPNRRTAVAALAGAVALATGASAATPSRARTTIAALWERHRVAKAEREALSKLHSAAHDRYLELLPDIPPELVRPNPGLKGYLYCDVLGVPGQDGVGCYQAAGLRAIAVTPAGEQGISDQDVVALTRKLVPVAERYEADELEANRVSGHQAACERIEAAIDRVIEIQNSIIATPSEDVTDFHIKALVIRNNTIDDESRHFADQIIAWFGGANV